MEREPLLLRRWRSSAGGRHADHGKAQVQSPGRRGAPHLNSRVSHGRSLFITCSSSLPLTRQIRTQEGDPRPPTPQLFSCSSDPQFHVTWAGHPSPPGVVKRSFVSGDSGKFLPSSQLGDLPLSIGSIFDCQQMEGQVSKNKGFGV